MFHLRQEEGDRTHLCHFEDALWVQAASAHLPCAGDRAFMCDGDDQARHRARLLLQSRVHYVSMTHLQENRLKLSICASLLL